MRGGLNALCRPVGDRDLFTVRPHILYSFENAADDGEEGRQIVLPGASLPLSEELAPQLQARIEAGTLRKTDFCVEDGEELDDVIGSLIAYGLLVRA